MLLLRLVLIETDCELIILKGFKTGLFSALLGNAGAVSTDELNKNFGILLTEGEEIELRFKLIRDTFIFTTKRMILIDKEA
jgi:hypothetical protein